MTTAASFRGANIQKYFAWPKYFCKYLLLLLLAAAKWYPNCYSYLSSAPARARRAMGARCARVARVRAYAQEAAQPPCSPQAASVAQRSWQQTGGAGGGRREGGRDRASRPNREHAGWEVADRPSRAHEREGGREERADRTRPRERPRARPPYPTHQQSYFCKHLGGVGTP